MSFDFSAQSTEYKTTGMIYSVLIMPYLTNASPQIIKLTGSQLKERVTFVSPSLKPQIPYAFMCILTGFGWLRNISDYVNDRLCIAWLVCILTTDRCNFWVDIPLQHGTDSALFKTMSQNSTGSTILSSIQYCRATHFISRNHLCTCAMYTRNNTCIVKSRFLFVQ